MGPGTPQPALPQLPKRTVTLGCSVWGQGFGGFQGRGHNLRGVLGGSEQLHVLPPSNCLLTQLRPGERLPESPPSSCKHLPRAAFAEATQHPLHPSLHPGTCRPAPTRGLLLLPAGLSPLPAGVSCLISPTRRPQWGPPSPDLQRWPTGCLTCGAVQGEGEEQHEQQDHPCSEHGGCVRALPPSFVPPCPVSVALALSTL